jgi:hypothetical protein
MLYIVKSWQSLDRQAAGKNVKKSGIYRLCTLNGASFLLIKIESFFCYSIRKDSFRVNVIYVQHYNRYCMPETIKSRHQVLIRDAKIIKSFIVPIEQLSEEALESRHKGCKRFRKYNTRKFPRKINIENLFHM